MIKFLSKIDVLLLHSLLIDEFGGTHGIRDEGGFDSALNAAENRAYYESADVATCAATYTYHLCKAHAFLDGNKRIAAVAAETFLELNDMYLTLSDDDLIDLIFDIADNKIERDGVEKVFSSNLERMS